ncbi:MAG: 50S ribosomal protein L18 [Planctomycetes bacterium]|nr:50S ribosomal protein L18 [Planctomycetota bacterium]
MLQARAAERRKWARRERRALRVRKTVYGTQERPRLSVYRSNAHFYAQIIDDTSGRTLAAASTVMKDVRGQLKNGGNKKAAEAVGLKLAEIAKSKGIAKVVFDRSFFRFHGRVRAFAEGAAKGGLDFLKNPKKKDKAPKAEKPAKTEKPAKAEKAPKEKKPSEGKPKGEKKQG